MNMKTWLILVSLLALVGCASAPPAIYMNSEPVMSKSYSLVSTTAKIQITASFFAVKPVKDIDGSYSSNFEFLPINQNLEISNGEVKDMFVRLAVVNPEKTIYTVKCFANITYSDGRAEGIQTLVARSELNQRTYTIPIPLPSKMERGSFTLFLMDDKGQELLRIGDLRYKVISVMTSR
jgi:hypothetical protein